MINTFSSKFIDRYKKKFLDDNNNFNPDTAPLLLQITTTGRTFYSHYISGLSSSKYIVNKYRSTKNEITDIIGLDGTSKFDVFNSYNDICQSLLKRFNLFFNALPNEKHNNISIPTIYETIKKLPFYDLSTIDDKIKASIQLLIRNKYFSFTQLQLPRINLNRMKIYDTDNNRLAIESCDFSHATIEWATLKNLKLNNTNLSGVSFAYSSMENLNLTSCNFIDAGFNNATIKNCIFTNCNLKYIQFRSTKFINVKFVNCNISNINLHLINDVEKVNKDNLYFINGEISEIIAYTSQSKQLGFPLWAISQLPMSPSERTKLLKTILDNNKDKIVIKVKNIKDENLQNYILTNKDAEDFSTLKNPTIDDEILFVQDANFIRMYSYNSFIEMLDKNYVQHPLTRNIIMEHDLLSYINLKFENQKLYSD